MNCRKTKRFIDEADSVELLPFEVNAHLDACVQCSGFAAERASLTTLMASAGRIAVPANFDVLLNRRLAERLASRRFSFTLPAFYFRMAGAAAMLVCLIVAGRIALRPQTSTSLQAERPSLVAPAVSGTKTNSVVAKAGVPAVNSSRGSDRLAAPSGQRTQIMASAAIVQPRRVRFSRPLPSIDPTMEAAALILMRARGTESELAVPVVSVGAQPLVYVSSQSHGEPVRVSF